VQRLSGERGAEVLEQEGNTAEGSVGQVTPRRLARLVVERVDNRVQLRIERLDSLDRRLDQLAGARLAVAHELRLGRGVDAREIGHGANNSRSLRRWAAFARQLPIEALTVP
jgi:hypothetical protein